jgi:spermidine synthase
MRLRDPHALELEYTRAMFAFLLFVPKVRDLLLIGLGGGSIAKFVHRHLPDTRLQAVEINPDVIAAARTYFLLPEDDRRLSVHARDGAVFLADRPESFDVLLVDGYDARRIVEDLSSPAFYTQCLQGLRPGGCAGFNLWGSDSQFDLYLARIEAVFGHRALLLPAEKRGNIQVFAFRQPWPVLDWPSLHARAGRWEAELGLAAAPAAGAAARWSALAVCARAGVPGPAAAARSASRSAESST